MIASCDSLHSDACWHAQLCSPALGMLKSMHFKQIQGPASLHMVGVVQLSGSNAYAKIRDSACQLYEALDAMHHEWTT